MTKMVVWYIFIGGVIGNLTSLIYCKINKVNFSKDIYGISHSNICIFIGTVSGSLMGSIYHSINI